MIDNEKIEQRKDKKKKARKASVIVQTILILAVFLAVIYGLFASHPEWTNGRFARFVPDALKERLPVYQSASVTEPEPVLEPTPSVTPTETPTPTPTPMPVPTIDPAIEALRLPSFEKHELTDWELLLVNTEHPIPDDYSFNLIYIDDDQEFAVDPRIANDLLNMLADCRAAGCAPLICSAYRDPTTQTYLYEEEEATTPSPTPEEKATTPSPTPEETATPSPAPEEAATASPTPEEKKTTPSPTPAPTVTAAPEASASIAVPGSSEHEIGLAVDIFSEENTELDESQERTIAQQWLMRHCAEYGFILRYPKGKSDLTGIVYEPWHYRYVGVDAAKDITENGLCLEEYIANMQTVREADEALAALLSENEQAS